MEYTTEINGREITVTVTNADGEVGVGYATIRDDSEAELKKAKQYAEVDALAELEENGHSVKEQCPEKRYWDNIATCSERFIDSDHDYYEDNNFGE